MRKIIFVVTILVLTSSTIVKTNSSTTTKIILSHYQVIIRTIEGQNVQALAEVPVRVLVQSDVPNWTVNYHATPLVNERGEVISPSQIVIYTPYTKSFESLDVPRLVGRGTSPTGPQPLEIGNIMIGFNATGLEKAGIYEGQIVSPDGGPTMLLRVVITKQELVEGKELEPEAKVGPKIKMTITPDKIYFPVTGAPGFYDSIGSVILSVESKYGFIIKMQATPLKGKQKEIPPSRIFVKSDGDFESLDKGVIVLERKEEIKPEKERIVTKKLDFRLKTTMNDPAGDYTGQIILTCEPQL